MGGIARSPANAEYAGLTQFPVTGNLNGMSYCISHDRPYALDLDTDRDVVCLLLGDIQSVSCFEGDREAEFTFFGDSAAIHPREGHIRVRASEVRHGFIAFGYQRGFEETADHGDSVGRKITHSCNNMQNQQIQHLARYARSRCRSGRAFELLELQCLGSLVYLEATQQACQVPEPRPEHLSDRAFDRIVEYVDDRLDGPIACPDLALAVDLPMRVVFQGIRSRTGKTPYRFILDKRTARAEDLLINTALPIAEIAYACGFSSQQHLTSTLTRTIGQSPSAIRRRPSRA